MIEELVELKLTCDGCKRFTIVKTAKRNWRPEDLGSDSKKFLPVGWTAKRGFMDFTVKCEFCSTIKSTETTKG